MRAIAEYVKIKGNEVSGSDNNFVAFKYLNSKGIKTYNFPNLDGIEKADIVIYTSAINEDNIELKLAKKLKKKIYERSEYLAEISKRCEKSIFISGCHGKSSVSSIICRSLDKMGYGFIGHIGAEYIDRESNLIYTGENVFISEACEYKKNFLNFNPSILTILNIDYDHPDSYLNISEMVNAYIKLAKQSKIVLINKSLEDYFDKSIKYVTFGPCDSADYKYEFKRLNKDEYLIDIYNKKQKIFSEKIKTILEYNIFNFAAAIITMLILKTQTILPKIAIDSEIKIKRRCEVISSINGVKVISDYAHHPKEILSIYQALSENYKNILVVFEPHTFTRTRALFSDFISALCVVDNLVLLPTFAAREKDAVDPIYELYNYLDKSRVCIKRSYVECVEYIKNRSSEFDLILLLGAGNIYKIGDMINMDKTVNNERDF